MGETFHSHLGKLLANTKDLLTRPSVGEQTLKDKETAPSLQDKFRTPQDNADHHAPLAAEKSKKCCIPFIALALVLLFSSLCTISLLGLKPVALAHSSGLVNADKREKSERRAGERETKKEAERGKRRASCRQKKDREDQEKSKDRISPVRWVQMVAC